MAKKIDDSWNEWIDLNIERGCDPAELYNILMQHDFSPSEARRKLGFKSLNEIEQKSEAPFPVVAKKLSTPTVEIYTVDDFLSQGECEYLANCIRKNLRKSTTTNDHGKYSTFRTSSTCDLGLLPDSIISSIDKRICDFVGISLKKSEPIQGQWYEVGQEFKAHTDYFEPNTKEFLEHAEKQGQRTWTFMVYLNNTKQGGATYFPKIDMEFVPKAGMAIIWNNLIAGGNPNSDTLHHGMPVLKGHKTIITKWFRAPRGS